MTALLVLNDNICVGVNEVHDPTHDYMRHLMEKDKLFD